MALMVYRETISGGTVPTTEVVSQVLGCLQLPHDAALRDRLVSNLGNISSQRQHNIFPLVDGFGEYDPRAFSLLEVMLVASYRYSLRPQSLYYFFFMICRRLLLLEFFLLCPSIKFHCFLTRQNCPKTWLR